MKGKQIYSGGTILTMETQGTAEAVLVEDGLIRAIGSREQMVQMAGTDAERISLEGRTMLPAFLDAHSHITALASTLSLASLDGTRDFAEIVQRLKDFARVRGIRRGEWIVGFGYDQNQLKEQIHPTKEVLDKVFPDTPVMIAHKSGHMGVANSKALACFGITANSENPEGGKIGRKPGLREPNGYLEETAFTSLKPPDASQQQRMEQMEQAQQIYFSHGITTIQDGLTRAGEWELLSKMAQLRRIKADIVCYPDRKQTPHLPSCNPQFMGKYWNRLKIGGYKIFLDGSPQGRTAWMTSPYEGEQEYCGYPIYTDEEVREFVEDAVQRRIPLLAHCNGDAACEQFLSAFERVGCHGQDLRPVMIHAQLLRPDQVPRLKEIGMIASFFVAHTYYWGDVHLKNFGKRAMDVSPVGTAVREGVAYTFHQDTPVIAPDMLETVWCACNRITAQGTALGQQERISVLDALKGVTKNVAFQYFEEGRKGSIAPGKLADFCILDKNPLEVPVEDLREISVAATIKEGEFVYRKNG